MGGPGRRSIGMESRQGGCKGASFVMTLWLEPTGGGDQAEWRWKVVAVQTGEHRYFRRLSELLAYVSERAGASPPA